MRPSSVSHGTAPVAAAAGRADLFRALDLDGEAGLRAMAELLGFEEKPGVRAKAAPSVEEETARPSGTMASGRSEPIDAGVGVDLPPLPFWRPVAADLGPEEEVSRLLAPPVEEPAVGEPRPGDFAAPDEGRRRLPAPVVAWPRLWRVLDERLRTPKPRAQIDVAELVRRWARGENTGRLPRLRGLVHSRVVVVLDHSPALLPFRFDQLCLAGELVRRLGAVSARIVILRGADAAMPAVARDERVLALSDLGSYGRGPRAAFWERFGERLRPRPGGTSTGCGRPSRSVPSSTACGGSRRGGFRWARPSRKKAVWTARDRGTGSS